MIRVQQFTKCRVFLTFFVVLHFFYFNSNAMIPISIGVHGDIVTRDSREIEGAMVEQVMLYPKKSAQSKERIMRRGVLVKRKNAKGTVLINHGFMCDRKDSAFLRTLFPEYNCMTFDMRAHGDFIEGQYSTLGGDEALDVEAAAQFLRKHPDLQNKPLFAYGFSMGAVASIEAQSKNSSLFDAMILDCPFDKSETVIKRGLEHMKVSFFGYKFNIPGRSLLQRYAFHPYIQSFVKLVLKTVANMGTRNIKTKAYPVFPAESIKKISVPCLFIHCKNDEKVSVAAIKKVFNNAGSSYKKLWITNGRYHYDSIFYNPERYSRYINRFTNAFLSNEIHNIVNKEVVEDQDENVDIATHINNGKIERKRK